MKIIVLQGKSNIGKTTVICKLYQKLCSLYKRIYYFNENKDGDFSAIFDIKGCVIGITSIGDKEKDLVHPFNMFVAYACEKIIVCCRKKNVNYGSKKFVLKQAQTYGAKISWYSKAYLETSNASYNAGIEIDAINDIQAKILLEEILL